MEVGFLGWDYQYVFALYVLAVNDGDGVGEGGTGKKTTPGGGINLSTRRRFRRAPPKEDAKKAKEDKEAALSHAELMKAAEEQWGQKQGEFISDIDDWIKEREAKEQALATGI